MGDAKYDPVFIIAGQYVSELHRIFVSSKPLTFCYYYGDYLTQPINIKSSEFEHSKRMMKKHIESNPYESWSSWGFLDHVLSLKKKPACKHPFVHSWNLGLCFSCSRPVSPEKKAFEMRAAEDAIQEDKDYMVRMQKQRDQLHNRVHHIFMKYFSDTFGDAWLKKQQEVINLCLLY